MAELLLELYSEEIPPKLQISARNQLKDLVKKSLFENKINSEEFQTFSSPTRVCLVIKDLPIKTILTNL